MPPTKQNYKESYGTNNAHSYPYKHRGCGSAMVGLFIRQQPQTPALTVINYCNAHKDQQRKTKDVMDIFLTDQYITNQLPLPSISGKSNAWSVRMMIGK